MRRLVHNNNVFSFLFSHRRRGIGIRRAIIRQSEKRIKTSLDMITMQRHDNRERRKNDTRNAVSFLFVPTLERAPRLEIRQYTDCSLLAELLY